MNGLMATEERPWVNHAEYHHSDQDNKIWLTTENTNSCSAISGSKEKTHKFQQELKSYVRFRIYERQTRHCAEVRPLLG